VEKKSGNLGSLGLRVLKTEKNNKYLSLIKNRAKGFGWKNKELTHGVFYTMCGIGKKKVGGLISEKGGENGPPIAVKMK